MTKTILVPLDGSELAERALAYATAIAHPWGATIVLLRTIETIPSAALAMAEAAGEFLPDAEQYLRDQAALLVTQGIQVRTTVAYDDAADGIVATANKVAADLIVMATHGRTGLGRLVFGSVAEAVLQHTTVPLLLVRAWDNASAPPTFGAVPRFLVTLDGSAFAEAALPVATTLATALGGELVLLHIVSPFEQTAFPAFTTLEPPDETAARIDAAKEYLNGLTQQGATGTCPVQIDVRLDVPTLAIAEAARDHAAALVVMATHGRSALGRLVLGSVADATLKHTRVPLLLVRPAGVPRAAAQEAVEG